MSAKSLFFSFAGEKSTLNKKRVTPFSDLKAPPVSSDCYGHMTVSVFLGLCESCAEIGKRGLL